MRWATSWRSRPTASSTSTICACWRRPWNILSVASRRCSSRAPTAKAPLRRRWPPSSTKPDIAPDHQRFRGNPTAEIAREKAGIIHQGATVVTLPQHPEANEVLGRTMVDREARAVSAAAYVPPVSPGALPVWDAQPSQDQETGTQGPRAGFLNRYPLTVLDEQIMVESPLVGRHQLRNVALAIAAAVEVNHCGFHVNAHDIESGV